jgi:hypothetical protein
VYLTDFGKSEFFFLDLKLSDFFKANNYLDFQFFFLFQLLLDLFILLLNLSFLILFLYFSTFLIPFKTISNLNKLKKYRFLKKNTINLFITLRKN